MQPSAPFPSQSPRPAPAPHDVTGAHPLPFPLPGDAMQRMVLVAVRRMAAHGIRDAQAAMLFVNGVGPGFRQPLVLLRAFVVELAGVSRRTIRLAPCCALRMTQDEARIVGVLAAAASSPACAARHLRDLAGGGCVDHPLSTAAAFNDAAANLGRPLVI